MGGSHWNHPTPWLPRLPRPCSGLLGAAWGIGPLAGAQHEFGAEDKELWVHVAWLSVEGTVSVKEEEEGGRWCLRAWSTTATSCPVSSAKKKKNKTL